MDWNVGIRYNIDGKTKNEKKIRDGFTPSKIYVITSTEDGVFIMNFRGQSGTRSQPNRDHDSIIRKYHIA